MKARNFICIILIVILGVQSVGSALAEEMQLSPILLDTNSNTNVNAVPAQVLQVDSVEPTTDPSDAQMTETEILSADTAFDDEKSDAVIVDTKKSNGDPDQPIITGVVPNADTLESEVGGESEDIGAPIPTPATTGADMFIIFDDIDGEISAADASQFPGIDPDEIDFISNGVAYVRSGFMKIADIKGESGATSGGNAETTWKVEEGEKAKKPREIVVVGSKTTDKSSAKLTLSTCGGANFVCKAEDVDTEDDLLEYVERTVNEYDALGRIVMANEMIDLDIKFPAKLLGFIPVRLNVQTSIATDSEKLGRVKVTFPWWHVFTRKTIRPHDFQTSLEDELNNTEIRTWNGLRVNAEGALVGLDSQPDSPSAGDVPTESISLNFTKILAAMLETTMDFLRRLN